MSYIEAFLNSNPADMSLRTKIIEGHVQDGVTPTPLLYFAHELALAGSMGLHVTAKVLTDGGILDQQEFADQLSVKAKPEMGAITWACLYQEIQNCLDDEVFDNAAVIGKINSLTRDAGIVPLEIQEPSVELISPLKMVEMRTTHQKDPTDALFFQEPFHLPYRVRKILAEAGFFSSKEALSVVEAWKLRAEILRGIPTAEFERSHRLAIEELLQSLDEF